MLPIGTETFRIFVDEAEDGVIRGRVSGGTFPEETPVSYTHLDVYKRQKRQRAAAKGTSA